MVSKKEKVVSSEISRVSFIHIVDVAIFALRLELVASHDLILIVFMKFDRCVFFTQSQHKKGLCMRMS